MVLNIPPQKLAVSSWCWASDYYHGQFSLFDLPGRAAAAGFESVEANDFMLPPPSFSRVTRPFYALLPHGNPELWRYRQTAIRRLKLELDSHRVRCLCWTLNTDFSRGGVAAVGRALYHRWGLTAAKTLNVPLLRIISGGQAEDVVTLSLVRRMTSFVQSAVEQLPHITVILENHWGISTDTTKHLTLFTQVKEQLPSSLQHRFALCLDPANIAQADRQSAWTRMAHHAGHVHLKTAVDNEAIDLPQFLETVHNAHQGRYDGTFTIEDPSLVC